MKKIILIVSTILSFYFFYKCSFDSDIGETELKNEKEMTSSRTSEKKSSEKVRKKFVKDRKKLRKLKNKSSNVEFLGTTKLESIPKSLSKNKMIYDGSGEESHLLGIVEENYDDLFSDSWKCCATRPSLFKDDFKFGSGEILISAIYRQLVDGLENSSVSYTNFNLTLLEKNKFVFPVSLEQKDTAPGLIRISSQYQEDLKVHIKKQIIRLPVIDQTAFYFKGYLANKYPTKISPIRVNPDPSDVIAFCTEFIVVPSFTPEMELIGKDWNKIIGILYCKTSEEKYEKISLLTLRKL